MYTVHRVRSLCTGLGLALALLLSTAGTAAAGPAEAPRAAWAVGHPVRLFAEWLASLWGEAGCTFDPNGACKNGATVPPPAGTEKLDPGCIFDPSGGCERIDIGCTVDPSGESCHGNG